MTRPGELALMVFGVCGFVVVAVLGALHLLVLWADRAARRTGRIRPRKNPLTI